MTAPVDIVLAIAVGAGLAALALYALAFWLERRPFERRSALPVDARTEATVDGCFSCVLASQAGDDHLVAHVRAEHPARDFIRGGRNVHPAERRAA